MHSFIMKCFYELKHDKNHLCVKIFFTEHMGYLSSSIVEYYCTIIYKTLSCAKISIQEKYAKKCITTGFMVNRPAYDNVLHLYTASSTREM
jgi:hypothetical protein